MRTEKEIRKAIEDIRNFINTEVFRGLTTAEGQRTWLDRIRVLRWVLEEEDREGEEEAVISGLLAKKMLSLFP